MFAITESSFYTVSNDIFHSLSSKKIFSIPWSCHSMMEGTSLHNLTLRRSQESYMVDAEGQPTLQ